MCVHYLFSQGVTLISSTLAILLFFSTFRSPCNLCSGTNQPNTDSDTQVTEWDQSCSGFFSTASLFAGLGPALRWISPLDGNCLKCHRMAIVPRPDCHFTARHGTLCTSCVRFSLGGGEGSPRKRKTESGGWRKENGKSSDANNRIQNTTFINNLDSGSCP